MTRNEFITQFVLRSCANGDPKLIAKVEDAIDDAKEIWETLETQGLTPSSASDASTPSKARKGLAS